MTPKYALSQDLCGDFHMTTWENYRSKKFDLSKEWDFTNSNGFEELEDVIAYVEKYFHIKREDIQYIP